MRNAILLNLFLALTAGAVRRRRQRGGEEGGLEPCPAIDLFVSRGRRPD